MDFFIVVLTGDNFPMYFGILQLYTEVFTGEKMGMFDARGHEVIPQQMLFVE